MKKLIKNYVINIFVAADQQINTQLGGDPDETLSSRVGKVMRRNGGSLPRKLWWLRLLVWLIRKLDPHHFRDAIENDEGKDEVLKL